MSTDPYSARVRALFATTEHAGEMANAHSALIEDQGVSIRLCAEVAAGKLVKLRFRAWACPHVIAAAEAFCEAYEGRDAADLEAFSGHELMQSLPVPVEKTARILVLEDAVRSLGHNIRQNVRYRSGQRQ